MPTEKLLFIANIWLDFYRAHNDAGLKLLNHVEAVNDLLIVTYQLEVEFKKNRQQVLIDSWSNLKPPMDLGVPDIVADAQTTQMLKRHMKEAKKRVETLKKLVVRTRVGQGSWLARRPHFRGFYSAEARLRVEDHAKAHEM